MSSHRILLLLLFLLQLACRQQNLVDTIYFNATIYTVNRDDSVVEALVVDSGKILFAGSKEDAMKRYATKEQVDLKGAFVYPGFIDAHCHFVNYGMDLSQLQLEGTGSWEEVIALTREFGEKQKQGWIIGRGWDQNDWSIKNFPSNEELNKLFPDRPVYLERVDGHACVVNQKALDLAGFTANTRIAGGEFITADGKLTGVLVDQANDSITTFIPQPAPAAIADALLKAQQRCFEVGLTTVADAGVENNIAPTREVAAIIDSLQQSGLLKMRMYIMVYDDESKAYYLSQGTFKTDRLNVRAFKFYVDGALGSRGALLKRPYSDAPGTSGLLLTSADELEQKARQCLEKGFQVCAHGIGDSANRMILDTYGKLLTGPNDKRWRIEHAQVIAPDDFELFHRFSIVPSVQTTHATSDMYWAINRLGVYRIKGAYAYRVLLKQNRWLANGSDFPVESINPLFGFYAATARKDQKGFPEKGFQYENALSREEALRAMTIWAAQANFEEQEKGSLEPGKFADFVVLEKDIMTIPIEETFSVKVLSTYANGEKVY